ncbi:MAG: hypothetical protein CVT49_08035 [candidate division Zixibacteria bacterium HGW-Zixibacteria-1]|nr:MAG: hypothetical protein CVT49_08035 [candidate division Zixibacteria bacterium HGW-Zixibacteria-1]
MAEKNTRKREITDQLFNLIFLIVTVLIIIRFIGSLVPSLRLWGFNHAGYINGGIFIYPILLLICFLIYSTGKRRSVIWKDGGAAATGFSLSFFPYLVIILFGAGFYFFSTKAHFLGDGYQLLAQLSDPTLGLKSESYGDMKIHQLLADFINGSDPAGSVYLSFRFVSIISGIIFILTLLCYGRKIATTTFSSYAFVLLNLFGASVVLFFGYVETYGPVTVFLNLFFISAVVSIKNGKKSVVPIVAFTAAVFFHKIAMIFFPSLLIYMIMIFSGENLTRRLVSGQKNILIGLAGLIVLMYLAVSIAAPLSIKTIFLSPFGDRFTTDGYFLLSLKHLIDYLNLVLFLSPLILVIILIIMKWPPKSVSSGMTASSLFIFISAVIGALAAFIIEPKLGMARDWDLFSTMLIPAQLAGIYLWTVYYESNKSFQPATLLLIVLNLSIFIPWLTLNNSPDGLRRYAIDIMKQDPKHGRTGLYTMVSMLREQGSPGEAEQLKKFCAANYPETEMVRQSEGYLLAGNLDGAEKLIDKAIEENRSFFRGYQLKARVQLARGKYEPALENFKIADALNPYNSENNYFMGDIYQKLGQPDRALELFSRSIRYDAINPFPYFEIANYFYERGKADSARYYFGLIPGRAKVYPYGLYYKFGLSGLKFGDTSKAIFFFDRYLEVGEDSALVNEILGIKSRLLSR